MCLFVAIVYAVAWTLLDRRDAWWRSGRAAIPRTPAPGAGSDRWAFLILTVTGSPRSGDVVACRRREWESPGRWASRQDSLHSHYQGLPCFPAVLHCRCRVRPWTSRPGSGSARPLPGGTWRRRSRCRTGAEAALGGPERGEGRARLRRPGRDADPHRPGRRRPAWKFTTQLRCCPWRAGQLAKAIRVLRLARRSQDEKASCIKSADETSVW